MPASAAYFDTSVLLKRYVEEAGSARARSLLKSHLLVSSAIAPIEAMSAICRRRDTGELSAKAFAQVTRRFQRDRARWELVEVTPQILDMAEELVGRLNVRTLDAVHLSSGHLLQAALRSRLRFVTADARQRAAATALSFECLWIGE
jgi:predicted nucleic acid-binding protein